MLICAWHNITQHFFKGVIVFCESLFQNLVWFHIFCLLALVVSVLNVLLPSLGKEQWTPQEDKILLSKDKTGITSLAKKRGLQAVVDRMNFMEGTS